MGKLLAERLVKNLLPYFFLRRCVSVSKSNRCADRKAEDRTKALIADQVEIEISLAKQELTVLVIDAS
jgi:hypothetical protein